MSERIEKILARELNEPRSRVKTLLQKGQVTVDGVVARAGQQADPDTQEICLAGEPIACRAFVYLMLNKPTGCSLPRTARESRRYWIWCLRH